MFVSKKGEIIGSIAEICIALVLVVFSIPVWNNFVKEDIDVIETYEEMIVMNQ